MNTCQQHDTCSAALSFSCAGEIKFAEGTYLDLSRIGRVKVYKSIICAVPILSRAKSDPTSGGEGSRLQQATMRRCSVHHTTDAHVAAREGKARPLMRRMPVLCAGGWGAVAPTSLHQLPPYEGELD